MVKHDIETNAVEPVFYAAVPDSFMKRDSGNRSAPTFSLKFGAWTDEMDSPILAPHDPWSF